MHWPHIMTKKGGYDIESLEESNLYWAKHLW